MVYFIENTVFILFAKLHVALCHDNTLLYHYHCRDWGVCGVFEGDRGKAAAMSVEAGECSAEAG
jgi:hypothetical protein